MDISIKLSYSKLRFFLQSVLILLTGIFILQGCEEDDNPTSQQPGNIVEVAEADGNFTTLLSAAVDANLAATLEGDGPLTVFAPTDEAFGNLPDGLLQNLSQQQLAEILSYHVVQSEIPSSALSAEQSVETTAGSNIFVTSSNGSVSVNDNASVVMADIEASNGIIHAIDEVLLPNAYIDVVRIISKRYDLQTLEEAVVSAGLASTLQADSEDGFTVFAPANSAFEGLDLSGLTSEQLQGVLTYHVLPTRVLSSDLSASQTVSTVNGETLDIEVSGDVVSLTDQQGNTYQVSEANLEGNNGVVHVIDGVLMPS